MYSILLLQVPHLVQLLCQQSPEDQLHGRLQSWNTASPPLLLQILQHHHHLLTRPHTLLQRAKQVGEKKGVSTDLQLLHQNDAA